MKHGPLQVLLLVALFACFFGESKWSVYIVFEKYKTEFWNIDCKINPYQR